MKLFKETDDIWRLYRREWVIVYSISMTVPPPPEQCVRAAHNWAAENLSGRVREPDIRLSATVDDAEQPGIVWVHIEVYKDNLKGEFKHIEAAQTHAAIEKYDEYTIVPRNSKSDHDIRNYGVVKL
jgi:hypothetical protein